MIFHWWNTYPLSRKAGMVLLSPNSIMQPVQDAIALTACGRTDPEPEAL
jgi:hypothetical protein